MPRKYIPKGGQPNKVYRDDFPERAGRLCREAGLTTDQLAVAFGVASATVKEWMDIHADFRNAVYAGRDSFDSERVERALKKRALGFSYTEVTRKHRKTVEYDWDTGEEKEVEAFVTVKEVTKNVAPDVTALQFWLVNRNPERWQWSSAQKVEHSGAVSIVVESPIARDPGDDNV